MDRFFILVIAFFSLAAGTAAQNPTTVAPDTYKLQFENDWVKVLRVNYAAKSKIPVHDHSRHPAGYVYLNDSAPITFRHTGWDHPILTRPAVTARSFRLSPTLVVAETHQVENPNNSNSEFLRIEFKTIPDKRVALRGRFRHESYPPDKAFSKVHFENGQARASRFAYPIGHEGIVSSGAAEPSLIVLLTAGMGIDGKVHSAGSTLWLPAGKSIKLEPVGNTQLELLKFDLRSAPLSSVTGN